MYVWYSILIITYAIPNEFRSEAGMRNRPKDDVFLSKISLFAPIFRCSYLLEFLELSVQMTCEKIWRAGETFKKQGFPWNGTHPEGTPWWLAIIMQDSKIGTDLKIAHDILEFWYINSRISCYSFSKFWKIRRAGETLKNKVFCVNVAGRVPWWFAIIMQDSKMGNGIDMS